MKINMIGSFVRNYPFGTEIAFAKGLKNIGVDVGLWDPSSQKEPTACIFNDPDALIVFKDHGERTYKHLLHHKNVLRVPVIEYQPDDIRAPGIRGMMEHMRQFCDFAFTFDETGAEVAKKELGYKDTRRLLVTADPELYKPLDVAKDIDICFVGSLSNPVMHKSRNKMVEILRSAGFQVEAKTIFDPHAINMLYNRSKVVLNHATDVGQQFGSGYGYQCRHFETGMTKSALLSNEVINDDGVGPRDWCIYYNKESLIRWTRELLDCEEFRDNFASGLYEEVIARHSPEVRAREIVNFIERVS